MSTTPTTGATTIEGLLGQLTLEEKVHLLTGRDFWTTWPIERIGLRRMLLSDGPAGVRGEVWDERDPSLNLPSGTALGATWDVEMAYRYGAVAAAEARRKDVDVVLGPTINLHRSPLGGRHFEALSEDPVLTADLAAAYVRGVQDQGVAATPKHYVANDYETERFTASTEVSERALRELYLLAFEKAITDAHAWAVMSAYNSINGVTATESPLLETPLNSEWGFDGVVVSDWTAVRSIESANAAQDLVMPGPDGPWGDALVRAVEAGEVAEAAVDRKVLRLLRLAVRVGALEGFAAAVPEPSQPEDGIAFVREAAAEGMVLVRNDGILPLAPEEGLRIAVIGDNADRARTQGGGSATVLPERVISPLDGIREAFPGAQVDYAVGAIVQEGVADLPLSELTNPVTGAPGVRATFLSRGEELFAEDRRATSLVWFGGDAPIGRSDLLMLTTTFTPSVTGPLRLAVASVGRSRIIVDGQLVLDANVEASDDLGAAFLNPPTEGVTVDVQAGVPLELLVEHDIDNDGAIAGALSFGFGTLPAETPADQLIAEAADLAAKADVAIVVVGTNSKVESEGYDRTSLALPGRQDDLVRAVAAANPRTIVAVNAGSPVELPWRGQTSALLLTWFGGQEHGHALADVLTGRREPGGRLPTTWPAAQAEVPVIDVTPVDGEVHYAEGIHIGYRAWLRSAAEPAFSFGSGLGYTTWTLDTVDAPSTIAEGEEARVSVTLTNTGERAGKQVVQVYASRAKTSIDRPNRWLIGWSTIRLDAGESGEANILVPSRAFAHWDSGAWAYESGEFTIHIGTAVDSTPLAAAITLR